MCPDVCNQDSESPQALKRNPRPSANRQDDAFVDHFASYHCDVCGPNIPAFESTEDISSSSGWLVAGNAQTNRSPSGDQRLDVVSSRAVDFPLSRRLRKILDAGSLELTKLFTFGRPADLLDAFGDVSAITWQNL